MNAINCRTVVRIDAATATSMAQDKILPPEEKTTEPDQSGSNWDHPKVGAGSPLHAAF